MGQGSRPAFGSNIPTGPDKPKRSVPDGMELNFGVARTDPARNWIIRAVLDLGRDYKVDLSKRPDLLRLAIDKGRLDYAYEMSHGLEKPPEEPYRFQGPWHYTSFPDTDCVIYYLRVGELVKIGVTSSLKQRLRDYPPNAVLLATEPGGYGIEQKRHAQFAETRAARKEWFHPSADLIAHINTLRETPLTAVDLAA